MEGCRLDLSGSGQRQMLGYRDHSNTFSVSINADNFFSRKFVPRSQSVGRSVGWLVGWSVIWSVIQLQSQSVTYSVCPPINQCVK